MSLAQTFRDVPPSGDENWCDCRYAIAREELPPRWWWEIRVERTSSRREILGGMQALPRPALNDID